MIRLPRLSGSGNGVSISTKLFEKDVRLTNHKGDGSLGVLLDDSSDGVDVFLVLVETIISNLVLAVGGKRRAVTVGQVVDDESAHDRRGSTSGVLRLDVSEVSVHGRDLGGGVTVKYQCLILEHDLGPTHSHTNVPSLATALALATRLEGRDGIASD